ncbi:MAG: ParB/RepB/Spo0J family partition protein [Acidimicrobiales bacterium]
MTRRSGLGRGLGALIPPGSPDVGDSKLKALPLSQIRPNRHQPRRHFDEEALATLVDSIKAVGILQPVLVREAGDDSFELIAGERRLRAAHRAGMATIPALIHDVDDAASLERALVENLHREDLNALDEAGAYQQLIEDFGLTHEEVAQKVGRSRASVTNSLRLFQLPPAVQRHVRDGRLSAGHARALLATPDRSAQEDLAREAIEEGLSVRALETLVRVPTRPEDEHAPEPSLGGIDDPDRSNAPPSARRTENDRTLGPRLRPPGVLDLEELLGDHLNTRVSVEMGAKRGRVVIDFATLDDLERIYRVIIGDSRDG